MIKDIDLVNIKEEEEKGLTDGFKMNLQLFADSELDQTPGSNNDDEDKDDLDNKEDLDAGDKEKQDNDDKEKQSLEDLLGGNEKLGKQFQDEINNAIQAAIKKRDEEHKAELAEKERISKLTAEELQAEKAKQLEEKERQIQEYELKLNINEYCRENNIDLDLAQLVHIENKDEIEEKFNILSQHINDVVNTKVEERLKENGYNPNPGDKNDEGSKMKFSEEDILNMTPEEINKYWDMI